MLSALVLSVIRTGVPALVGALAAWLLATFGVQLPDEVLVEAVAAGTAVLATLYYIAARVVERRWPSWSWLLGSTQQPTRYEHPAPGRHRTDADPVS